MPSQTVTTPTTTPITIAGRKDFVVQLWSAGAAGLEPDIVGGTGGGGGMYFAGTIPNDKLVGATQLTIVTGDVSEITSVARDSEDPQSYGCYIKAANANYGAYGYGNAIELVTITGTHAGGAGGDGSIAGGGGGGSGGTAADGNFGIEADGNDGGPGGEAVSGGGAGGAGGSATQNGFNGASPGGGAGAGAVGFANGTPGGAKAIISWTANTAPTITSGSGATGAYNVTEGNVSVGTITATGTAPIVFSAATGADAAFFIIDGSTGALEFVEAPDYEDPQGSGGNAYEVIVTATNGIAETDSQTVTVTVVNDPGDDPPPPSGTPTSRNIGLGLGLGL